MIPKLEGINSVAVIQIQPVKRLVSPSHPYSQEKMVKPDLVLINIQPIASDGQMTILNTALQVAIVILS